MSNLPADWSPSAHTHWVAGRKQAAFDAVTALLNAAHPDVPRGPGLQFAYYLAMHGDWRMAANVLSELHRRLPDDAEVRKNLATCCARSGQHEAAIQVYRLHVQACPNDRDAWDGLADASSALGHHSEAKRAGETALKLKDRAAAQRPLPDNWAMPTLSINEHLTRPGPERENIVSFSLWGDHPRYLRGALRNALLVPELLPGWRCRFAVDPSVPQDFVLALENLGTQVVMETRPECLTLNERLARRFWVANDPTVGRFLVRDTDSVIGQREVMAVRHWISSGRWFHTMRDWWTHTDLMLAGMWGGVAGVLPDLRALCRSYTSEHLATPNWDQWFLRDCVWAYVRSSCLQHDRCYQALGAKPFPGALPTGHEHVGQDEFAARPVEQARWLGVWIDRLPCLQLPQPRSHIVPLPAQANPAPQAKAA